MKKTAPDHVDHHNRRVREDNTQSKHESGYSRVKKKTKRTKIGVRDVVRDEQKS